ncbi:hypothetical protein J9B83_05310 [Marinomonas sp. A79]|uniref:Lipoprotein n=1 Tax=Marinomonas vulgaris TaxID=2823372 RepID=A0ABS5HBK8_9GAMM|nr:hypothetical protein [Marinomonas vulgaris]MBR7888354.1 hypothetical protein [Marinomonas vulgaris]
MKKEPQLAALIAVATLTLAGCASSPDSASSLATDAEQTQTITQIDAVRKAITEAEGQIKQATEEELSWFASNDMDAANKALAEAKKYYAEFEMDPTQANKSTGFFSSQTNISATEDAIVQFNTHLTSARDIKATALDILTDAFDYRTQLTLIDAQEYFPSTVEELNKTLKKLVDQVADGKTDSALAAQPALVAQQRTLEVKTVTAIYLTDAK